MSERIDHEARALEWIRAVDGQKARTTQACAQLAVASATLALVEQQRIANLVEMAQSPLFNAYGGSNPALDLLMEKSGSIRPEAAAALGIKEEHR